MNSAKVFGLALSCVAVVPGVCVAQFAAATGEVRGTISARYQLIGGVPHLDESSVTIPLSSMLPSVPVTLSASTPEANGQTFLSVLIEPSRLQLVGQSSANAWCDAPLETCGSRAENSVELAFELPHGGAYLIEVGDALVQNTKSASVVIRDENGFEVRRIEDDFIANVGGVLAPGAYTIEAGSVADGEGEIPPHIGGYAAWSLALRITPATPPCPGDADGDSVVTFSDVTTVLARFGSAGAISAPGDADGNGIVEFADITAALAHFGAGCG